MSLHTNPEFMSLSFWDLLIMTKNSAIGIVVVGLLFGAIYFAYYLLRLSRLPKNSREYRQLSYHM